ncbi:MAG TPA: nucleotide exchange factor GrpE [Candidatus Merdibacter merdavium]|uniref:Protein GrpE n=1 Tax=Candidatus Merdibacter merdavium TaxID=2838692 RepID=A0A9D2SWF6_9FIRM|nr:nucleotide exchange factor GrpE [Candidatus Merdibacter merdavium]
MQDEKKIVKEENAVPEEAQEEAVPKESEADTEVTQEESAEAEKKPRKEKKLFKKDRTAELEAKIAELEQALADQKNAYYKAYADTENLKKRLHAEAETTRKYRIQSFALELLPILDALERALAVPSEDENIQNYVKGFEMIHDQLVGILEKEGVKEIDALNKPFDHNYHQALMQEPVEGVESGIVVEVLQKGYMLKDRVLRAALVKVSE